MTRVHRAAGIAFERRGQGDPLVLIHGTGGSRRVWDPVVPLLELERDIVAVDLPGFGESPPFPDDVDVTNAAIAGRLERLFDELELGRPHVAGTSLGGHVALALGARDRASSVVATSPTGFWTAREALYTRSLLRGLHASGRISTPLVPMLARSAAGRKMLLGTSYTNAGAMPAEAVIETVTALVEGPGFAAVWRAANRERLGGAPATDAEAAASRNATTRALDDVPVTIAWAEHDRFLPRRQAERARRALPAARHVLLRGCGHLATWDDPPQVAQILLDGTRTDAALPAGTAAS